MEIRIIPLICPSCGAKSREGLKERSFGGEMQCDHCGNTAVLVIDNVWSKKTRDDYVCVHCGRIARKGDRFCECSMSLQKQCVACQVEFFIGKNVCPNCGWDHKIDLSSEAVQAAIAEQVVQLLEAKDYYNNKLVHLTRSLVYCVEQNGSLKPKAQVAVRRYLSSERVKKIGQQHQEWASNLYRLTLVDAHFLNYQKMIMECEEKVVRLQAELNGLEHPEFPKTELWPDWVNTVFGTVGSVVFFLIFSEVTGGSRKVFGWAVVSFFLSPPLLYGVSLVLGKISNAINQPFRVQKSRNEIAKLTGAIEGLKGRQMEA